MQATANIAGSAEFLHFIQPVLAQTGAKRLLSYARKSDCLYAAVCVFFETVIKSSHRAEVVNHWPTGPSTRMTYHRRFGCDSSWEVGSECLRLAAC